MCVLAAAMVLGVLPVGSGVAPPAGAATDTAGPAVEAEPVVGPAAQRLAERYAPVIVLRRHDGLCGSPGEQYAPMTVEPLLGNPEVALRQVGNGDPVMRWAPTARDLYGRGQGVYLDLPGDSLRPGCLFAGDSARYTPLSRSAVYAHVVQQADRPGFLAVQYWLFWYYNDWNDKREGDWEFVQVLFRASSVEDALASSPDSAGYAQHTGGEVSAWTSEKMERDGTHAVVYSSEDSHASYVEPALFLGRGSSEGFGCDNTQAPSTRLRPRVVLLPDAASGPDDPFAWLAFQGRWGERQHSPNNGPTGPATKPRWHEPVTWQDGLRDSSFAMPGGSETAPAIIGTFCTVVGWGSVIFTDFVASPARVLTVFVVLGLLLVVLLRRTSWRRVPPLPVVSRRRAGEIARAAVV
ncbi:MAG: Vps62-related protein, partial [Actinomycetes bacterium]